MISNNATLIDIRQAIDIIELNFSTFCHEGKLCERIIAFLDTEQFLTSPMHCTSSRITVIHTIAERFIIEWSKFVNNILCNKVQQVQYENYIFDDAKRMSTMYLKKK